MNVIVAPVVSTAGTGKIYFDSTSNTFKVSQNAGAFANLSTGATANTLTSAVNTLTSVVNGTFATAPIINTVAINP